ncbi:alanine racemase [Ruminococcus gauvreauii]|uniref:Alanine racemase n=1 Tax=Ruminococcus gauvreauii TaxID=438033 RepID=A0ABY5VH57_9FIRM|nr:alanine racemase [Ruminococcus gauvreauii]UWP59919.1 alanine racemase [Ruminococcus gauvreauii]
MTHQMMIQKIAEECGTPFYLFDLDQVRAQIREVKEILGERVRICYAMKANPFLVRAVHSSADGFEVCSPGELRICERLRIPVKKIVLSGVYKEKKDLEAVMARWNGSNTFTAESLRQLQMIEECAANMGLFVSVLLRVTSGNQFGMDEALISEIVETRNRYPHVRIEGLQFYSGTQKHRLDRIEKELRYLDELLADLEEQYGYHAEHLEYGPGLFIPYFQKDGQPDQKEMLAKFAGILHSLAFDGQITLEMGRYLAASCGEYVTAIVDMKQNRGQNYCIVDGGIHHLNYYGQSMAMKIPFFEHLRGQKDGQEQLYNICGSLCTVGDVLVKQLPLTGAGLGDLLVFQRTGAYSVTEGIHLFLSRDLPKVFFCSEQYGVRLVRGDDPTDVINSEREGEAVWKKY